MVSPVRIPVTRDYTIGRGRVFMAPYDTITEERIFRYIGNSPVLNINVTAPRSIDHESSMSGFGLIDDKFTGRSNSYRMNMALDEVNDDNLGLFFGGGVEDLPDLLSTDPVRAWYRAEIEDAANGRQYFMTSGEDVTRNVPNSVPTSLGTESGPPAVPLGQVIVQDRSPSHDFGYGPFPYVFYGEDQATAVALRDANLAADGAFSDVFDLYDDRGGWGTSLNGSQILHILLWGSFGNLTWSVQRRVFVDKSDQSLGTTWAQVDRLSPPDDDQLLSEVGDGLTVDRETGIITINDLAQVSSSNEIAFLYTIGAGRKVSAGAGGKQFAEIRYFENNPRGPNRVWVFPRCVVSPEGEFALKGSDWRQMNFVVDILPPDTGEAIQVFGSG